MQVARRAPILSRLWKQQSILAALPALLAVLVLASGSANAGTATVGAPQSVPGPAYLTSIACVDAHTCYVIGRQSMDSGPAKLFTFTDGSVTQQQTIIGANFMQQLACSRGGACYALGSASLSSSSALLVAINNGVPGKIQTVDGVGFWDSLACNGSGACYAVGGSSGPNGHGVIVPIADGQAGAVVPVPGTLIIWDIDCPTADTCYAIGSADLDAATLVMPVVHGQPGAAQTMQGGGFTVIACPSSNTCYAGGYSGSPASTNAGQGTGGVVAIVNGQPGAIQTMDGAGPFASIACPTSTTCFALGKVHGPPRGSTPGPLAGAVVPIANGVAGSVITVDLGAGNASLGSADCPSSSTCYALTEAGIVTIAAGGG